MQHRQLAILRAIVEDYVATEEPVGSKTLAAKHGYTVTHYDDQAIGLMAKDTDGKVAITLITLRPQVQFSGPRIPDEAAHQHLHHLAHESCYLASSIKSEIRCEPVLIVC